MDESGDGDCINGRENDRGLESFRCPTTLRGRTIGVGGLSDNEDASVSGDDFPPCDSDPELFDEVEERADVVDELREWEIVIGGLALKMKACSTVSIAGDSGGYVIRKGIDGRSGTSSSQEGVVYGVERLSRL